MSTVIPKCYQTIASIIRLQQITDFVQEDKKRVPINSFDNISLKDVNFSYEDKMILNQFNHNFNAGDLIWIKGKSGLGKTTLFKLLLGFIQPNSGSILLNKGPIETPISAQTRNYFSYVPQHPYMLSLTIKENLTLGKTLTDEDIRIACIKALIYEDIMNTEYGFDTVLGENGFGLSKGQLQRLSIARALLRDSPIILLDEVTSALDPHTEQQILLNLKTLKDKTILIISHRDLSLLNLTKEIDIKGQ